MERESGERERGIWEICSREINNQRERERERREGVVQCVTRSLYTDIMWYSHYSLYTTLKCLCKFTELYTSRISLYILVIVSYMFYMFISTCHNLSINAASI